MTADESNLSSNEQLYVCECAEVYGSHHPECPAQRQLDRQRAEIERLTRERDEARDASVPGSATVFAAVEAERDRLRAALEEIGGYDCENYCKHLRPQPCGKCITCIARAALTADAPHCPTCGCGGAPA